MVTYLHTDIGDPIVTITTLSSRQFNQDASKAKKAAMAGPVFITDRGRPAHVLLTFEHYKKLTGEPSSIADLLAMPWPDGLELETHSLSDVAQAAEFS